MERCRTTPEVYGFRLSLHLSASSKTPQGAHFLIERRQIVEARGGVEALDAQRRGYAQSPLRRPHGPA
jgi:hypothetical protein